MAITPILRDDNGFALVGRGSELYTRRYTGIGIGGQVISAAVDVKEVILHIEGETVAVKLSGTVPGSEEILWTSDGRTLPPLKIVREAGQSICTLAAQSGTINVSVIAWR